MGAPFAVDMGGFIAFPVTKNTSEIKDLGRDVAAAVGVNGGDSAHVRAVLAEAAEFGCIEEANV